MALVRNRTLPEQLALVRNRAHTLEDERVERVEQAAKEAVHGLGNWTIFMGTTADDVDLEASIAELEWFLIPVRTRESAEELGLGDRALNRMRSAQEA